MISDGAPERAARGTGASAGWRVWLGRPVDSTGEGATGLIGFVLTAAVVGALTGLAAASFRVLLQRADQLRDDLSRASDGSWWGLIVIVLVCAAATAIAASLVRRVELDAEGSGIPHVEAVVEGRSGPGRFRLLPVKYVGGLLSIGAGLALGREGPSVQMGGTIAAVVARVTRRHDTDLRILVAGGAAAGLAVAFNAPIAGGVFVLEELVKRFDPRTTVATLVASASGFAAAYVLGISHTEFHVPTLPSPRLADAPWVLVVGVVTGLLGVLYSRAVLLGLRGADATAARVPAEVRAALVGALIGLVVWGAPHLAGGGNNLTQSALLGHGTLLAVAGVFGLRFVLGSLSYAAGTPGGLFAPMLVLGADIGLFVGLVADHAVPHGGPAPAALALIGMAAFFTAAVRAPVTGLILATEMTGSASQLPPMLGACAIAMLVAIALRSEPIYDALTRRAARR